MVTSIDSYNAGMLIIRLVVGLTLVAHGYNHLFGGGRIEGAARWYGSMGLQPARTQAWMSVIFEFASGAGLALGFLTPLAASAAVGLMTVAGVVAHRPNGFFVFKEGYEYVLMIAVVAVAIAILGPGKYSFDHAFGFDTNAAFHGGWAALIAIVLGLGGAIALLATSWTPPKPASTGEQQS
jgi:putative oxidoreductase